MKKVLVSRPQFLKPAPINEIAKIWKDTTMDVETMLREHDEFVEHIKKRELKLNFLNQIVKDRILFSREILEGV